MKLLLCLIGIGLLSRFTLGASCPSQWRRPMPEPSKCWKCPDVQDLHTPSISDEHLSYTDFNCRYTESFTVKTGPSGKGYDYIDHSDVKCGYNGEGKLKSGSNKKCPRSAIRVPNCTDSRDEEYTGPYEVCCSDKCRLHSLGTCFHCPDEGGDWVDIDINDKRGTFECTYRGQFDNQGGRVTRCTYNSTDGGLLSGDCNRQAPQDPGCTSKYEVPIACPKSCPDPFCFTCPRKKGYAVRYGFQPDTGGGDTDPHFDCEYPLSPDDFEVKFSCSYSYNNGSLFISSIGTDRKCPKQATCTLTKKFD